MASVYVGSEVNELKQVLIHKPDDGIARVSPKRASELLFDDIVHLPQMVEEHALFERILKAFLGDENVLEAEDLITEGLAVSADVRQEIVELVCAFEELPNIFRDEMLELSPAKLAKALITGYVPETDTFLFDPIPNFIFTRDIAVVVKDHVVVTKAAKEARHRENLLTRFMFWENPRFRPLRDEGRIINLNRIEEFPPSRKGERVSMEGGDMMVLDEDFLLIGCSERSTDYAFESLKNVLFEKGVISNLAKVKIPVDRAYMHIDTVFTRIDKKDMLAYQPIVLEGMTSNVDVFSANGLRRQYPSIREFIRSEINADMHFIECGRGVSPYQEREQWTDACNLLAVRPGVAIAYDRNLHTEEALKAHGYTIIPGHEFLQKQSEDPDYAASLKKTIVTLVSSELSRARGGSHCMSCPILRAK